jgi:hypothetical protein
MKMIDIMGDIPKEKLYYDELSIKLFVVFER